MAQEEVLRMVAAARDQASGPLRKVENALKGLGKQGGEQSKLLRESFKGVHEQFRKVGDVAREAVSPAIEAIGVSSLSAVGAVAALVAGLKSFVEQGDDVAAFGRRVQLTTDTIRGLEGVADKFHVDPGAIRQGEQSFTEAMFQIRRRRGEVYAHLLAQRRDLATELSSTPETTEGNEKALKSFLKVLEDVKRVHGEPTARAFSKEVFGTDAFVDLLRKGNAGLEEAIRLTLKLRGNMDDDASEKWVSNWSDFKATIEGVRNVIGNDLLPDLTELAKQGQAFFSEHKKEIAHNIAEGVREIGEAFKGASSGLKEMFSEKNVKEARSFAESIGKIHTSLRGIAEFAKDPLGSISKAIQSDASREWDLLKADKNRLGWNAYYIAPKIPIGQGGDSGFSGMGGRHRPGFTRGAGAAASIIQGLRDRGLDASHAAILGGNIEQESGFDPTRPNVAEGGIGLIQWNKERRAALQAMAAQRHKLETDAGVQLDFMMKELNETPQGRAFLAAQNPDEMNRSLHQHIRYGDNSEGRRLSNGLALLPLAERSKPGSLLAASGGVGGGTSTVTGSASLSVDVRAPAGTKVRADADGLFKSVEVNRGLSMPRASEAD